MSGIDDDQVRVTEQPDGTDLIWLPHVAYLDTQAGPVELGIDRDIAEQLFHALGAHLTAADGRDYKNPRRGDAVEAWLKARRDEYREQTDDWFLIDEVLDQYRLHADTGTPLGQHVCEGGNVDDCHGCYEAAKGEQR